MSDLVDLANRIIDLDMVPQAQAAIAALRKQRTIDPATGEITETATRMARSRRGAGADLPSRTFECVPCQETYFAGAHAGAGPFFCEFCLLELTLRPEGAEPYAGGASLPENTTPVQFSFAD